MSWPAGVFRSACTRCVSLSHSPCGWSSPKMRCTRST
ncbi:hypothetical protein DJ019_08440 [Phenylobacterium kunshanense]|uniref:Uncharacterized protein n=1 Tax=Phenylobacterium kunshanense TaxID=1445034 RepID=A0A328BGN5_9CAUL|nr:hypothetical protein DJ019_08440 [Phenylobacterium kunshanense]